VKRARKHVRLSWRDSFGAIERVLEVSHGCPHCACTSFRRADMGGFDASGMCTDSHHVPVECARCSGLWAHERAAPASSAAAVEQAQPRSIRARIKRVWCELVGRRAS
jgi:hypothetical protein